ncbi:hypothetical protein [Congregibacter litoralis]|uniref:Uncharacterized protein n=1 Tax=Congregibacter litoralis KT71 TaxID=314285 RepID=A4AD56_9GAMM|nr:hypothetical protein [Congregibacter litoralis]EAQ96109.2 hypothetical protein KT71_08635 [Congregibacter litoralis KT71]
MLAFNEIFDDSQARHRSSQRWLRFSSFATLLTVIALLQRGDGTPVLPYLIPPIWTTVFLYCLLALSISWSLRQLTDFREAKGQLERFQHHKDMILYACQYEKPERIDKALTNMHALASNDLLAAAFLREHLPQILGRLAKSRKRALRETLIAQKQRADIALKENLHARRNNHPILKAKSTLEGNLLHLKSKRQEMMTQWDTFIRQTSWWTQLTAERPDFSELDKHIQILKSASAQFEVEYGESVKVICKDLDVIETLAKRRLDDSVQYSLSWIEQVSHDERLPKQLLSQAMWCAAMSIPVSIWNDLTNAGSVYDALRSVNVNFQGMSDSEIWWETMFMQTESLAGLVALTKGAYFEKIVASNTGGELFEHFNNPTTDITIDGIEFQIKATNSLSYVESVPDHIPVIATTEVAEQTGAIDGGVSNEELTRSVELAVGGSVVDAADSAADAIISGLGGMGLFASIAGIDHFAKQVEHGGDKVEAAFEGFGVAITGTAKASVDLAELGYKAVMSRPSRFIGRQIKNVAIKLDSKLMET